MLEPEGSGDELAMVLVELLVGVKLFGDEDLQQVVDEFSLQELDRLELQQVVEQEGLRVRERGHDAALSLLARLAGILCGVGAEQLDHHLLEKTRVQFVETEVSSKEAKSTRKNIALLKLMGPFMSE